jgi:argininosuccinate synthase
MGRRLGRLVYEGKWYDPEAWMLKDALTRWLAPSVTGEVTIELRRGDDYTILDTRAEHMAYAPDKLSMEKVEQAFFTQEDRIGALEMQSLNVADNRALLLHHLEGVRKLGSGKSDDIAGLLGDGDE